LRGTLGNIELGVEIDVYSNERIPVETGILNKYVSVIAEPRGHHGRVIESFYELLVEEEMKAVVEEFAAEILSAKVPAYAEVPLWKLTAAVHALRDYSFAPSHTVPLWYRPWHIELAKDLHRLAPRKLKAAGLCTMMDAVKNAAPDLLRYLTRYYNVKQYEDALLLIPLTADAHEKAVAGLVRAMKAVKERPGLEGYIAFKEELA
jgi:hypothetical protein